MTATFHLRFLGPVQVERDGAPVRGFRSRKALALLGYLTVQEHPVPRARLVDLFWDDRPEVQGRANLSWVLNRITTLLPGCLQSDRHTVRFHRMDAYWLDTDAFQALAEQGEATSLETAVALYRGEFLEGLYLDGCAEFEIWLVGERERWRQRVTFALEKLVAHHCQGGAYEQGIGFARRLLALEPWREETHQQMMRLLASSGQRSAALAQYETCRQLLAEELGVEPSKETRTIYDLLLKEEPLPDLFAPLKPVRKPRVVGACPYRGLSAFREEDAPFFFGREDFTHRLNKAMRERARIAVIVGSSGSGKSSVVFAGLLPRLREEGNWLIVNSRPGAQPFQAQAAALLPLLEPDWGETDQLIEIGELARALRTGDIPLHDVAEQVLQKTPRASRLLLVVDQFEELYTLCPEPELRERFLDGLLAAVEAVPALTPVLTLRADFMGQALRHRPFADTLQESALILGPMTREELRAAIERPAEKQGAAFEAGLAERVLDDVGKEPGNLPLLEFALALLWERHEQGWLTHTTYEEIGGVAGALARYADQVYEEMGADERTQARHVFGQLVRPGEGTEDTRRVATLGELGEESWALVQHLADRRLVVTGQDPTTGSETVEVVHEALIQRWEQLRAWMEKDRTFRIWQERLRAALSQWEATGQDEGGLLRGAPLAEAEEWLDAREAELSTSERAFIQTSVELQERQVAERERRIAERDRRRRRTIIALAGGLVVTVVLALVAVQQRQQALVEASIGLASQAVLELEGSSPERSVLLALEALEDYPYTWQAERALGQAVLGNRLRLILQHEGAVNSAWWSSDGTRILAGSYDGTAKVWDALTGQLFLTLSGHQDDVPYAVWSPSEEQIVTSSRDGTAKVWNAASGKELFTLSGHTQPVQTATWSPDGSRIATAGGDGTARMWDAITGEELLILSGHTGSVWQAVWSPDGLRIATRGEDGTARVWDTITGKELLVFAGHMHPVSTVAWSPSGDRILTADKDGTAMVWDAATGKVFVTVAHDDWVNSAIWSSDGTRILTASDDFTAKVWDASTGVEILTCAGHKSHVLAAAWSPSGDRIATGSMDGTVKVWDATTGTEILTLFGHTADVTSVVWSPLGDRIVTVSQDGTAKVWDPNPALARITGLPGATSPVAWSPKGDRAARGFNDGTVGIWDAHTGEELLVLSGHKDFINDVAWPPSGDRIWTASADGTASAWDAITGERLLTLKGHSGWVFTARLSPDGTRIVTASDDGTAQVWDADTGIRLLVFRGHKDWVRLAVWSPDGTTIATTSDDGTTKIWDPATGAVIRDLYSEGYGLFVGSAGWSPDGTRIATCAADGIGRIWDITTGEELVTFTGHTGFVWGIIGWSRTEQRILTNSADGTARVWDATTGAELLCYDVESVAGAAWSPEETRIAIAGIDGTLQVFPAWQTTQELIDYAKECCVIREFTAEEREQFGLSAR